MQNTLRSQVSPRSPILMSLRRHILFIAALFFEAVLAAGCVQGQDEPAAKASQPESIENVMIEKRKVMQSLFQGFLAWDEANRDELMEIFAKTAPAKHQQVDALKDVDGMLATEKQWIAQPLDAGLEDFGAVQAAPRQQPPLWPGPDGYIHQNGRVAFVGGFGTVQPPNYPQAKALGGLVTVLPVRLEMVEKDGTLNPRLLSELTSKLAAMEKNGLQAEVLLIHTLPTWVAQQYPEIKESTGHFVDYDIEHPVSRRILHDLIAGVAPLLNASDITRLVCLANEPDWGNNTVDPREDFYKASRLNLDNYARWLEKKYKTVEKLTSIWGASFQGFEEAAHDAAYRTAQHKASWYDWCIYKQSIVNDWLKFISTEVKREMPNAITYAKVTNEMTFMGSRPALGKKLFSAPHGDTGIDRETWMELTDASGSDTRTISALKSPVRSYWEKPGTYCLSWMGQGMGYDFTKSLAPHKMIFESEWHAINTVLYADPNLSGDHVRQAVWLAHVYGVGMNWMWYWSRNPDGRPLKWSQQFFYGSLLAMPQALDAYVLAMEEVNAVSNTLASFSQQPRPVQLLYSENSSIQSLKHRDALQDAYEALTFAGYTLGFTTEKRLQQSPLDAEVVILPACSYADDATVAAIEARCQAGKPVIILGDEPLAYTPQGEPRPAEAVAFLKDLPAFAMQEPRQLRDALHQVLPASDAEKLLGSPIPWGLIARATREGGKTSLFLSNVSTKALSIAPPTSHKWFSALTGHPVDYSPVSLEPRQTLLVHVEP